MRRAADDYGAEELLTFADVGDVEVEPSDGEVGVLDLLRHRCLLAPRGRTGRRLDFNLEGSA